MRSWLLLVFLIAIGCGSGEPTAPPQMSHTAPDSAAQPTISRDPADVNEVRAVVDLGEYPGSKAEPSYRLTSDSYPPDEVRFELHRTSDDSPEKVAKFFEKELGATQSKAGTSIEIFGPTAKGNSVRVSIEPNGKASKYSLNIICYVKK